MLRLRARLNSRCSCTSCSNTTTLPPAANINSEQFLGLHAGVMHNAEEQSALGTQVRYGKTTGVQRSTDEASVSTQAVARSRQKTRDRPANSRMCGFQFGRSQATRDRERPRNKTRRAR